MAKQPTTDRSLTAYLRASERSTQTVTRPNVVLSAPVPASSVGVVVGKVEVFDATGTSLGFLPLYSSIT